MKGPLSIFALHMHVLTGALKVTGVRNNRNAMFRVRERVRVGTWLSPVIGRHDMTPTRFQGSMYIEV